MKIKIDNRGGLRIGSGRKSLGYETKILTFRVRVQHADEIKELVKKRIKTLHAKDAKTKK